MEKNSNKKKIIISILIVLVIISLIGFTLYAVNHMKNLEDQISDLKDDIEKEKEKPQKEETETKEEQNEDDKEEEKQNSLFAKDYIVVPDLTNKTVTEATKKLKDLGFKVSDEPIEISDDNIEAGLVVKTSPPSGSKRTKGTVVTIYVSKGDSKYEIEDYTGQNYLVVKGKLEAYGIIVYIMTEKVSNPDKYEENTIISQNVKAGTKLKSGDVITLTIPE